MLHTRDLTGTVVAITGATAGIGRETARLLVKEGARVALGGRRADRLEELVAELGEDHAVGVPMDVRSPADNARLIAAAVDRWDRLDSVIPNAGIVSSVAGFRGGADEAVYAGTKHAQVGLAGSLDRELRERGVRVTLICPAATATEFAVGAGRTEADPRSANLAQPVRRRCRHRDDPASAAHAAHGHLDLVEHGPGQRTGSPDT